MKNDKINNYELKGLLVNEDNAMTSWVNFPTSVDEFEKICSSIGLNYDYDDIKFYDWRQTDRILDLCATEDITLLSDIVKDIQNLDDDDYIKLLAVIEVEGTISTYDADMFGIDLINDYHLYKGATTLLNWDNERHCKTKYGVLQCNNL